MFSIDSNLLAFVKKQYQFKLKAYNGLFFTLAVAQIIALFFSFNGIGSAGIGSDGMSINVKIFSGEMVIAFTMIWAFIVGHTFTTEGYRNNDFSFISTRLSSNLSNIAFIVTASLIGGITASLSSVLLRVMAYFFLGSTTITNLNFFISPFELLVGMIVTPLYLLLISAIGYFFGTLTQRNKAFSLLLPTLFLGLIFFQGLILGQISIFLKLIQFYVYESSLLLFTLKVITTIIIIFYTTILLSNRMEVRK